MHLGERFDHGQPDAQAPLGSGQRAVSLGEELEDVRQKLGPDPLPSVAYADHDFAISPLGTQADVASLFRILDRVREQIRDDLLQPRRVGVDPERAPVERDGDLVALGSEEVLNRIDGLIDRRRRLKTFLSQLDLALRHARDVEQVVDQAARAA